MTCSTSACDGAASLPGKAAMMVECESCSKVSAVGRSISRDAVVVSHDLGQERLTPVAPPDTCCTF